MKIEVLRPDDLLFVTFETHNLVLATSGAGKSVLVREHAEQPAFLVAQFQAQAFLEQAFFEAETETAVVSEPATVPGSVHARMSGPSRLAFRVPDAVQEIPFDTEGLLDWSQLEPSLSPAALQPEQRPFTLPTPSPRPPTPTETAIELPYRLLLSPLQDGRWRHPRLPVVRRGRTELWETALALARPEGGTKPLDRLTGAPVRAVWSPDFPSTRPDEPPLVPLTPSDRSSLVNNTSTFPSNAGAVTDQGKPALAHRLALSALGGGLDVKGAWPKQPPGESLIGWEHQAEMGRDLFVKVARVGRYFPLGHRAVKLQITERRFETNPDLPGQPISYLRKYEIIVTAQPLMVYTGEPYASGGREMPLREIRINLAETPKLALPAEQIGRFGRTIKLAGGNEFLPFPCTAVDIAGNVVHFDVGLCFVDDRDIQTPIALDDIFERYKQLVSQMAARVPSLALTLAPAAPGSQTTSFITTGFGFGVEMHRGTPNFLPFLGWIEVRAPAVEAITGSTASTSLKYFKSYLDAGFDVHAGIFAEVSSPGLGNPATTKQLDVGFSAANAGGIAKPDLSVRGFAREIGPVGGDLSQALGGQLDLDTAFSSSDAVLFGVLRLKDLVDELGVVAASPKITTELSPNAVAPTAVLTRMSWSVPTKAISIFEPRENHDSRLGIDVRISKPLAPGGEPTTQIDGTLTHFKLTLVDAIRLTIDEFHFASGSGVGPQVDVSLASENAIEFLGALAFVKKLTDVIPPGLFGDNGPRLTLSPEAIEVGFALTLPPLAIGVFSLRHVGISTALTLPFLSGLPRFSFSFATREKPFELAVLLLGGGGFVRVELDADGVRVVEGMLEFGGVFAMDVGVASGSVKIVAGIYFKIAVGASALTGFVSVSGEVTVLAIVSVSIEFMLSLSYYIDEQVAKGVAKVSLSVRVAFLSKSVSFSVEKSFSGGSKHLSIGDAMMPSEWNSYAAAFA